MSSLVLIALLWMQLSDLTRLVGANHHSFAVEVVIAGAGMETMAGTYCLSGKVWVRHKRRCDREGRKEYVHAYLHGIFASSVLVTIVVSCLRYL
jgi:hypothetical protein